MTKKIEVYQYTPAERDSLYKKLGIDFDIAVPPVAEKKAYIQRYLCIAILAFIFRNSLELPLGVSKEGLESKIDKVGITKQEIQDVPEISTTDYYVSISLIREFIYSPKVRELVQMPRVNTLNGDGSPEENEELEDVYEEIAV